MSEIGLQQNNNNNNDQQLSSCQLLQLRSLDLSYNKLTSLLAGELALAPGLKELRLRGNRLSVSTL